MAKKRDANLEAFGRHVRGLRIQNGMTVAALAKQLSVSRPYVSRVETGSLRPAREKCELLAKVFGVDTDGILARVGLLSTQKQLAFVDGGGQLNGDVADKDSHPTNAKTINAGRLYTVAILNSDGEYVRCRAADAPDSIIVFDSKDAAKREVAAMKRDGFNCEVREIRTGTK